MHENEDNEKLIVELKEIIKEYEQRLNSKDQNFQLQFSELQNELILKYSEIENTNLEKTKIEFQFRELEDLIQEKNSVIRSKDNAIHILQEDLKEQMESIKSQYEETLSVRQEEIESLRMTSNQLREQLIVRENDIIGMMQRHEDQIVKLSEDNQSKNDNSTFDQMINALKEEISDVREILFQKQESLKVASIQIEEQDKRIHQLQDTNLCLIEEAKIVKNVVEFEQDLQSSEASKEAKKKQLSLKGKVKSLEKQCESLKNTSLHDQEQYTSLNKELTIREQVIEKQNTLIDELRQTETNLRRNLDKLLIMQQEQLIELNYWKNINSLKPTSLHTPYEYTCDSFTPLQAAIDTLINMSQDQSCFKLNQVRDVIDQLKAHQRTISEVMIAAQSTKVQLSSLQTYVDQLHNSNIDLQKLNKGLVIKFENVIERCDIDVDKFEDNFQPEDCSREELLLKLQMISRNSSNYTDTIAKLEYDIFNITTELNKTRESNEQTVNVLKKSVLAKDKEITDKETECRDLEESLKQLKTKLDESCLYETEIKIVNEELSMTVERLQADALLKERENEDILVKSLQQSEQIEFLKLEVCNVREDLMKTIEQLKEEIMLKDRDISAQSSDHIDELALLKLNLKNSQEREEAILTEKEQIFKTLKQLEEDVLIKNTLIHDLNEQIVSLKLELDTSSVLANNSIKENEEIKNTIEQLNERVSMMSQDRDMQIHGMEEQIASLKFEIEDYSKREDEIIKIKEELMKTIEQLKEEIMLKDRETSAQSSDLIDELALLKLSSKEFREREDTIITEKAQLIETVKQLEEDILTKNTLEMDLSKQILSLKLELDTSSVLVDDSRKENEELKNAIEQSNARTSMINQDTEVQMNSMEAQITSLNLEREQLLINLEQLKDENTNIDTQFHHMNDEITSYKLKLEKSSERENTIMEEKQQLMKTVERLEEIIHTNDQDADAKSRDIIGQIKLLELQLKESIMREEVVMKDNVQLTTTIEQLKKEIVNLNEEVSKMQFEIIKSGNHEDDMKQEMEEVMKHIEQLEKKLELKNNHSHDMFQSEKNEEMQSNDWNKEIILPKLTLQESSVCGTEIIEEKEELMMPVVKSKEELLLKDVDTSSQSQVLIDKMSSIKIKLEESRVRENTIWKEKEQLLTTVQQLRTDMLMKDNSSALKLHDLEEQIVSMKLNLDESCTREEQTVKEKNELTKALISLKEEMTLLDKERKDVLVQYSDSNKEVVRLHAELEETMSQKCDIMKAKEELTKTVEQLKEELSMKDRTVELQLCDLHEDIISLKYTLSESNLREDDLIKEKEQLMKSIEQLNEELLTKDKERNDAFVQSHNLKEQIALLTLKSDESSIREIECTNEKHKLNKTVILLNEEILLKDRNIEIKLIVLNEEIASLKRKLEDSTIQEKLLVKRNEELDMDIRQLNEELLEKDKLYNDMIGENESLRLQCEDSRSIESELYKEKEQLMLSIDQMREEIVMKTQESDGKLSQVGDLEKKIVCLTQENEELIKTVEQFKQQLEESKSQVNVIRNNLESLTDEKNKLLKTIERLKDEILLKDKEVNEKQLQIGYLNEQIASLTCKLDESCKYDEEIKSAMEDNNGLRDEILLKGKRITDLEELCEELNEQLVSVKLKSEEYNVKEEETLNTNKELIMTIEYLKSDLLLKEKEVMDCEVMCQNLNEQIRSLNLKVEESDAHECDLQRQIVVLMTEKEEIEKSLHNINATNLDSSGKIQLSEFEQKITLFQSQVDEKEKTIQKLEKANLLLKAKSLKLKKQYDEKLAQLNANDLPVERTYPVDVPIELSANRTPYDSVPLTGAISSDEMSFMSRIQSLSDDVDSKARKVNLDIEKFLENNEQVTSCLSSNISPKKSIACNNSHCQHISTKNRQLVDNITNLRQQNELMKNKLIDLQCCLEQEQEARKQINQESVLVHESLVQKISMLSEETEELNKREKNKLAKVEEEVRVFRIQLDEQSMSLKQKEQENEELKEMLVEEKKCIYDLNVELQDMSRSKTALMEDSRILNDKILVLNEDVVQYLLKNSVSLVNRIDDDYCCFKELFVNVKTLISINDLEVVKSVGEFVETVKDMLHSTIASNNVIVEQRCNGIQQTNFLIEKKFSDILARLDGINEACLYLYSEKECYEKIEHQVAEGLLQTNNEEEIDNRKNVRMISVESACEDCLRLKEELENVEKNFVKILEVCVPDGHGTLELDSETSPRVLIDTYIDVLKNQLTDRCQIKNMVDSPVQTVAEFSHIQRLDELMITIIGELPDNDTICQNDGSGFIDLWEEVVIMMRNQLTLLRKELSLQAQEKCEISDKFERLFTELESSCDSEIEELKTANTLLNREVEQLQEELECRESTLRNYEIQISYLQSVIDKPENEQLVQLDKPEHQELWLTDLNDALKETISEKEDHITELMDQINVFNNLYKESSVKSEQQTVTISNLETEIENLLCNIKLKEKSIQESNAVINELEAVCVEKENRINFLEKESSEINFQLEQYISAVCSMQARLDASKPNLELILTQIENKGNNMQLLNLIDQLEKDYADELEQSEQNKSVIETKLSKAIQIIHKLKKQLKESHLNEVRFGEKLRVVKLECHCRKECAVLTANRWTADGSESNLSSRHDTGVQIDDEELRLVKEENNNFKGIIENLHVNNFLLWKELDSVKKTDRNIRASSLPPMNNTVVPAANSSMADSERSLSPISQLSWNSGDLNTSNNHQLKDLQRKLQRVHQQLNQMRIERNRIHQEYSRVRQLKEAADCKIAELVKRIDKSDTSEDSLTEKDELTKTNNQLGTKVVELQSEIEMITVRNSILETKCKKIEIKLTSQRRKYDQLVLKLDEKEQEIDRGSDELRRQVSSFEKEKITWLREKKELKSAITSKEEKITNLRKKLSNKTVDGDNGDSDYLTEISQLQSQLTELRSDNKQNTIRHREQIAKYQGQIEELIDDNRQLQRKLSVGYVDSNMQIVESQKTSNSLMKVIEEDSEESVLSVDQPAFEINTMLANVVSEKEKLLTDITNLNNKLLVAEEEIKALNDFKKQVSCVVIETSCGTEDILMMDEKALESNEFHGKIVENESIISWTQTNDIATSIVIDACCGNDDMINTRDKCEISDQTLEYNEWTEEESRTSTEYKVDRIVQVSEMVITISTQTGDPFGIERSEPIIVHARMIQTDDDEELIQLKDEARSFRVQYESEVTNKSHYVRLSEKLRGDISDLHNQLSVSAEEIKMLNITAKDNRTFVETCCGTNREFSVTDKSVGATVDSCSESSQTLQLCQLIEHASQTNCQELLNESFEKNVNVQISLITSSTQTDSVVVTEWDIGKSNVGSEVDNEVTELRAKYQRQISKNEQYVQLSKKLKTELDETLQNLASMECKNLEYQELIGALELQQIAKERTFNKEITKLSMEIVHLTEKINSKDNPAVELYDKADQTVLCQPADEGWDMESDYEKLAVEHHSREVETLCNAEVVEEESVTVDSSQSQNNSNGSLIAILREEIDGLKNTIGDKNMEIGQLKCLRNQLQTDLLESGQQIKESNMEFLNLKENIQVLRAERDILRQKVEDLDSRFPDLVNFIELITIDLQRLRDSYDEDCGATVCDDKNIEADRVKIVVHALEHELHKLLEQLRLKDSKLENAFSQIDQLSCTIHRLQLQLSDHVNDQITNHTMQQVNTSDSTTKPPPPPMTSCGNSNIHDECVSSINELSELLEKKHLEIEGLKSRLFLATDQLIHFRTFFANTDNRLHKELLLITRHQSLGFSDSDAGKQSSMRDHTKLIIDSDDQSDSDQSSMVSHDGNTVIRVERSHASLHSRNRNSFWLLDHVRRSPRYKRLVHNFKRLCGAGRRQLVTLRSQPRINFRAVMVIYLTLVHLLLMRCLLL